jgi:RNA polymerase sigma factor (sigma-70 family)
LNKFIRQRDKVDNNDDILYIEQVLTGKINSFSYLVDKHKDNVYNLAFRICCNHEDAEEIAQDSFLKAYRSLKGFRMKSSFATWLYRIVYNTSISYIRSKKRRVLSLEDFPADAADFTWDNTNGEEAYKEYRNSLVNFALQKISEEERGLISLYYYEEMSTEEISDVTGISKSNIKVKLFRARQKMYEIIDKVEKKNSIYHELPGKI